MGRACVRGFPSTRREAWRSVSPRGHGVSRSSTGSFSIGAQFSITPTRCCGTPRPIASSASSGEMAITRAARRSTKVSSAESVRLIQPRLSELAASPDWTSWNQMIETALGAAVRAARRSLPKRGACCRPRAWSVASSRRRARVIRRTAPRTKGGEKVGTSRRRVPPRCRSRRGWWRRAFRRDRRSAERVRDRPPRRVSAAASSVVNGCPA